MGLIARAGGGASYLQTSALILNHAGRPQPLQAGGAAILRRDDVDSSNELQRRVFACKKRERWYTATLIMSSLPAATRIFLAGVIRSGTCGGFA
jgi:hypothetical protein